MLSDQGPVCMQTRYLFSRERANVDIDSKEYTDTLIDSGYICSHIWKGTISRESVSLDIHSVHVEITVPSTRCRSYQKECVILYRYIYVSRLGRKPMLTPKTSVQCLIPDHLPCETGLFNAKIYLDLSCFKDALFWQSTNPRISRLATQLAFGMREK